MAKRDEERERREVRELLDVLDREELKRLCIDYFPAINQRFGHMELLQLQNSLLENAPLYEIRQALVDGFGDALRKRGLLRLPEHTGAGNGARQSAMVGSGAGVMVNRGHQTDDLLARVNAGSHSVLLLPGALVEAHALFLARAGRIVPSEPPVRVEFVHWGHKNAADSPQFPTTPTEFLRALAVRLGGADEGELPRLLAQELMQHRLLFLHPRVERCFDDAALGSYYTTWLAEVLRPLKTRYHCVFVQPISWMSPPSLGELFFGKRKPIREDAVAFMDRLQAGAAKDLPIFRSVDLAPITEEHIRKFLRDVEYCKHLSDAERLRAWDELVSAVLRGSLNSEQILHKLSLHLPGH